MLTSRIEPDANFLNDDNDDNNNNDNNNNDNNNSNTTDNDKYDNPLPDTLTDEELDELVYQSCMKHRVVISDWDMMEYKQMLDQMHFDTQLQKRRNRKAGTTNLSKIVVGLGFLAEYPEPVDMLELQQQQIQIQIQPSVQEGQQTQTQQQTPPPTTSATSNSTTTVTTSVSAAAAAFTAPLSGIFGQVSEIAKPVTAPPEEEEEKKDEKPRIVIGAGRPIDQSSLLGHYVQRRQQHPAQQPHSSTADGNADNSYFGYMKTLFYGQTDDELVAVQEELLRRQLAKKRIHDERLRELREQEGSSDSDSDYSDSDCDNNRPMKSWMYENNNNNHGNDNNNDNDPSSYHSDDDDDDDHHRRKVHGGGAIPKTHFSGML